MNYIKEINAFYDRQELEPLSSSAIALWFALMHINNKSRWKKKFTVPNTILRYKAGLTESSFKRARNELVSQGYIEVESQTGGKAPIYKMNSLVVEIEYEDILSDDREEEIDVEEEQQVKLGNQPSETPNHLPTRQAEISSNQSLNQPLNQPSTLPPIQPVNHVPDHEPAPLYRQYINKTNTKQNETDTAAADSRARAKTEVMNKPIKEPDAIMFYQENFGLVGPFVAESLQDWITELGEELVIEAMKRALERNKTSWSYVKSILNAWYKKGIRTLRDAKAEQVAFEKDWRQGRSVGFFREKNDIVPEWYEEERRKREEREREKQEEMEEVTVEQVEEVMRRYWEGEEALELR